MLICTGDGGDFAVRKGGEIVPWLNFGATVPSFTTAAGIVFPDKAQARLRTRLGQAFLAKMHESDDPVTGAGAAGIFSKALTIFNADVEATMERFRMFRCFGAVIWAYGHWSFGDFKGRETVPERTPLPPPPRSSADARLS